MPLSDDRVKEIVLENLTPSERREGVAYLATSRVAAGWSLQLPGAAIEAPWDAFVAFVDGAPLANWAHPARYLLVNAETGEVASHDVRLPPRRDDPTLRWRVAYRAPPVPDEALEIAHPDR